MAESSWATVAGGHAISDTQWEQMTAGFMLDGVIGLATDAAVVFADATGLQVKVRANKVAVLRGHGWTSGVSDVIKAVTSNSSGSTRTDLVVLRLARATMDVSVVVKAGTPGAGAPALEQDAIGVSGNLYEIPLATVTVASGAATIVAGNVTPTNWFVGAPVIVVDNLTKLPSPLAPGFVLLNTAVGAAVAYFWNGLALRQLIDDSGGWIAYTPVFTASGASNPAIGSGGILTGRYRYLSTKLIEAQVTMTYGGAGASAGNGFYRVTVPLTADPNELTLSIGVVYGRLSGLTSRPGTAHFLNSTQLELVFHEGPASDAIPFAWTNGSTFTLNIIYTTT